MRLLSLAALLLFLGGASLLARTIFVDGAVTGGDGSGDSWQNASATLQDALGSSESIGWLALQSKPGNPWPYRPFMYIDLSKPMDPLPSTFTIEEIHENGEDCLSTLQALCDPESNEEG